MYPAYKYITVFHLTNLLYQFVALLKFEGSVLQGGAGSVVDLLPLLIGRLTDVWHSKAQGAQSWTWKTALKHLGQMSWLLKIFHFKTLIFDRGELWACQSDRSVHCNCCWCPHCVVDEGYYIKTFIISSSFLFIYKSRLPDFFPFDRNGWVVVMQNTTQHGCYLTTTSVISQWMCTVLYCGCLLCCMYIYVKEYAIYSSIEHFPCQIKYKQQDKRKP